MLSAFLSDLPRIALGDIELSPLKEVPGPFNEDGVDVHE